MKEVEMPKRSSWTARAGEPEAWLWTAAALVLLGGVAAWARERRAAPARPAAPGRDVPARRGAARRGHIERAVTVLRPAPEVYRFWRDFEEAARRAAAGGGERVSRGQGLGPLEGAVRWDAEMTEEVENDRIVWRARDGGRENQGRAEFRSALGGCGTQVRVVLEYRPPIFGAAVPGLFGGEPERDLRESLRRFKQLLEAGEVPTTEGQPSCREAAS
jgi:uncharacterized membrane protein